MGVRAVSIGKAIVAALAIAVLAGAVSGLVVAYSLDRANVPANQSASPNPMADAIDAFHCRKGLNRIVLLGGIEDGFARSGSEPSRIDARLLYMGGFAQLARGGNNAEGLRGYDQGGVDMVLIDHLRVPAGIVSGQLLLRMRKGAAGADNDGLRIGDLDLAKNGGFRTFGTGHLWAGFDRTLLLDGSELVALDFAKLPRQGNWPGAPANLAQSLAAFDHETTVDMQIADDTEVDAAALLACQIPREAKGVTLSEYGQKVLGADFSWLSCSLDQSQEMCDPFAGDRLCSAPGPLACYHDGAQVAPPSFGNSGISPTSFVGGEVRLSSPVRGDSFAHLADADGYCQAEFGAGWRVLSYHEGGGGAVASYSRIAPGTRVLVNIKDQQYGNCWDRDVAR